MKHRSSLLAQELSRWPDVSMRPMFGLRAFYRGTVVFAMLPHKRGLESAKNRRKNNFTDLVESCSSIAELLCQE